MRLLHLDTGREMRGGQELLLAFAKGLRAKGHEQTIACTNGSPVAMAAQEAEFHVVEIGRGYSDATRAVRHILDSHPHDLAASHDARAQTIAYLATTRRPIVRVAHRHVTFAPKSRLIHRWKYTHTCHAVVATSEAAKEMLIASGIPAERVTVVRGGVAAPASIGGSDERARMRLQWGLGTDDFVIGHVASFTKEKGQRDALDALLLVLPKHPNVRMILAGDGPLRHDSGLLAKAVATNGAAQLPGYIKPDADFYAGIDLFIANSTSEALGLSALHAMAHQVPVIATEVGGLPEVVGDSGWLIPPASPEVLAAAILPAIMNPEDRLRRGERARERTRGFSIDRSVEKLEALYLELTRSMLTGGDPAD